MDRAVDRSVNRSEGSVFDAASDCEAAGTGVAIFSTLPEDTGFPVPMRMDYAFKQSEARIRSGREADRTKTPWSIAAPRASLSWALLSPGLCSFHTGAVGLSFFLLVSVCLGDRDIRVAGAGLPQAEDLDIDRLTWIGWQGDSLCCPCRPGREDAARQQHKQARRMKVG